MIGRRVGSYTIEAELGKGGMGAVYRARHVVLGRPAAIKILLPHFSANEAIVQRFFNEARAATEIRHPGIVEIYDFGSMEDGAAFIAMEMLDGESLATRMRTRGHLGVAASLKLVRQMCSPLGAAHERQIVHRDLKPDNVFIVPDPDVEGGERIKLLDFGIAKVAHGDASTTSTGAIMGTPMYMSPEQCRGVTVDWRADIYSLGCMLYELVAMRTPFLGEGSGDIMGGHMYMKPAPIAGVDPAVWALIERMLAKAPADRPQSTREVAEAIDRLGVVSARISTPVAESIVSPVAQTAISSPAIAAGPARTPGPHTPAPSTTLSSSNASIDRPPVKPKSRRLAALVGGLVVVGGVATAAIVATSSNDGGSPSVASSRDASTGSAPGSSIASTVPAGSDLIPSSGSADAVAAGSDTTGSAGSAAGSGSGSDSGSAGSAVVSKPPAPATITVDITGPSGSTITVDGRAVKGSTFRGKLARSRHVITVAKPGYTTQTFELDGRGDVTKHVALKPIPTTGPITPPLPGLGSAKPGSAKPIYDSDDIYKK